MKEWVESLQGGVTRCPDVPPPQALTIRRCLSSPPCSTTESRWGTGTEGRSSFLGGAGWLGARTLSQALRTHSLVAFLSLHAPPQFPPTKPFLISLAGGEIPLLSTLIVPYASAH